MIDESVFKNATVIDFFDDMSEEEKLQADMMAYVAMAIHDKRISMGMTQKEFADLNNVSQAMVSKWESGDYNFTLKNISAILQVLNKELIIKDKETPAVITSQDNMAWKYATVCGSGFFKHAASPAVL